MNILVFIRGLYHSEFVVFDTANFLNNFCINMDIPQSDVKLYHALTEEQKLTIKELDDSEDNTFLFEDEKALVRNNSGEVILEIPLVAL